MSLPNVNRFSEFHTPSTKGEEKSEEWNYVSPEAEHESDDYPNLREVFKNVFIFYILLCIHIYSYYLVIFV